MTPGDVVRAEDLPPDLRGEGVAAGAGRRGGPDAAQPRHGGSAPADRPFRPPPR